MFTKVKGDGRLDNVLDNVHARGFVSCFAPDRLPLCPWYTGAASRAAHLQFTDARSVFADRHGVIIPVVYGRLWSRTFRSSTAASVRSAAPKRCRVERECKCVPPRSSRWDAGTGCPLGSLVAAQGVTGGSVCCLGDAGRSCHLNEGFCLAGSVLQGGSTATPGR